MTASTRHTGGLLAVRFVTYTHPLCSAVLNMNDQLTTITKAAVTRPLWDSAVTNQWRSYSGSGPP